MRQILMFIAVLGVAGCDYKTRLVTVPSAKIDNALIGTWQRQDGDARLQIVRLSDFRYAVLLADTFAVVTPSPVDDIPLFQAEFVAPYTDGTRKVKYGLNFVQARRDGDVLKLAFLSQRVVPFNIDSRDALAATIVKNKRSGRLFPEEATFVKTAEDPNRAQLLEAGRLQVRFLERIWKGEQLDWEELMRASARQQAPAP